MSGGTDASIKIGNGTDNLTFSGGTDNNISIGEGDDTVSLGGGSGNPNSLGTGNTVTLGNGAVTVGRGQDTFIFDQTTAGSIQAVKITGFDSSKDVIQLTTTLVPSQNVLPTRDDAQGNAVITVDNSGDTINASGRAFVCPACE